MAERRMFAKSIVLSDAFLDMPMSARCLYFTLGMLADDDGFIGNPKSIMRQCGASQDDMVVLLQKRFVLSFDNGVIVIKHWRMNNYLRNDRHTGTTYLEEMSSLAIDDKGAYTEKEKVGIPVANQVVYPGKVSIGKDSIDKDIYSVDEVESCDNRVTSSDSSYSYSLSISNSLSNSIEKDICTVNNNEESYHDSLDDSSSKPKTKRKAKAEEPKKKYGEFGNVLLTETEYIRLGEDYGEEKRDAAIKYLDLYIPDKGYKSKSHNMAMRRWVFNAIEEKEGKGKNGNTTRNTSADEEECESTKQMRKFFYN